MINLYRYVGNNFGDNLSTYITQKISGQDVRTVSSSPDGEPVYAVIGSILEWIPAHSVVWGTGYMREQSRVGRKPFTIHAVRGKLTRDLLIKQGFSCPEVYGDPALLCPLFYTPDTEQRYRLGVIPHYVDAESPLLDGYRHDPTVLFMNVRDPVEKVIREINSCKAVISSSLHGLIVADAYRVPATWAVWSDLIVGKGFKFRDYCSVRGQVDLGKLMEVCPFRGDN